MTDWTPFETAAIGLAILFMLVIGSIISCFCEWAEHKIERKRYEKPVEYIPRKKKSHVDEYKEWEERIMRDDEPYR